MGCKNAPERRCVVAVSGSCVESNVCGRNAFPGYVRKNPEPASFPVDGTGGEARPRSPGTYMSGKVVKSSMAAISAGEQADSLWCGCDTGKSLSGFRC